jgi:hypothetical protein
MASVVPAVTPVAGVNAQIVTGGTPLVAILANANGGYIVNPASNTGQGIASAEILYVDPVGNCAVCQEGGTIIALHPGDRFECIPGSTSPVYVNALTPGHKFTTTSF